MRPLIVPAFLTFATLAAHAAQAESIGSVDTVFKLIGPDHKIACFNPHP